MGWSCLLTALNYDDHPPTPPLIPVRSQDRMSVSTEFTANKGTAPGSNVKDWAYEMGILPQSSSIVFTKAQLIEFLKTKGVEVGPNFTELNRLPKYAAIGKFSTSLTPSDEPAVQPTSSVTRSDERASVPDTAYLPEAEVLDAWGQAFRPSRRVRQAVGGSSGQVRALFASVDDEDPSQQQSRASAIRARRNVLAGESAAVQSSSVSLPPAQEEDGDQVLTLKGPVRSAAAPAEIQPTENTFRPSRRVRVPGGTGGKSSIILG